MKISRLVCCVVALIVGAFVSNAEARAILGHEIYDSVLEGKNHELYRYDASERNPDETCVYTSWQAFRENGELVVWTDNFLLIPVELESEEDTFQPYFIHGTTTASDLKKMYVVDDKDLYEAHYRGNMAGSNLTKGEWNGAGSHFCWPTELNWDAGPRSTRKWVRVELDAKVGYSRAFSIGIRTKTDRQVLSYNNGKHWIWTSDNGDDDFTWFQPGGERPSDDLLWQAGQGLAETFGPYVPGEKVSATIDALVGYTAKGLPSGLKLNKKTGEISGMPKKPTAADGVAVTFTKKGAETLTSKFIVGPIPTINVALEGDTEKCKVSGANKAYLVGKKVSLTAKGPKGTAFAGWFKDGEPWPNAEEYLNAKLKYVMTAESLDLVAKFEKEKMSIDASALESASFAVGTAVAEGAIVINVETQSGLKSLKAAKLPSGLKLKQDKATGVWSISGTPKKAESCKVTLTATAKSGAVETVVLTLNVEEKGSSGGEVGPLGTLPEWATGTFQGTILDAVNEKQYGMIYVTVSKSGRVDARVEAGGKTYEFSAPRFDGQNKSGDFVVDLSNEAGDTCKLEFKAVWLDIAQIVSVSSEDKDGHSGTFKPAWRKKAYNIDLWRNDHGEDGRLGADPSGKAVRTMEAIIDDVGSGIPLQQFDPKFGDAVLVVGQDGSVSVSGTLADGVSIPETGFLGIDDPEYWTICNLVHYDESTGNVYELQFGWTPEFDGYGDVYGWVTSWSKKVIEVFPFK